MTITHLVNVLVLLLGIVSALPTSPAAPPLLSRRDYQQTGNGSFVAYDSDSSCHGNGKNYIHFIEPNSPNVTLAIETNWIVRYTKDLKRALSRDGFEMVTTHGSECGWVWVDTVMKKAVDRGKIGFRQTMGLDAMVYYQPSEETVGRIRRILEVVYPWAEITMVVVFCTLPVSIPIALWTLGCCCKCIEAGSRKVKNWHLPRLPVSLRETKASSSGAESCDASSLGSARDWKGNEKL